MEIIIVGDFFCTASREIVLCGRYFGGREGLESELGD